jgi:serine/threonine protein kinase
VTRVTKTLVVKFGRSVVSCEAQNMTFALQNTSIPVPRVHRWFQITDFEDYGELIGYIVMDYIEGTCLENCWNDLGISKKESVLAQTSDMIRQLQSVQIKEPGPIGGGLCEGKWFTHYGAGPFPNQQQFESWFNRRLCMAKQTGNAAAEIQSFKFSSFVLTHLDITPRNLIMDLSGQIWLIDWGHAGGYPPIFEAATVASQPDFQDFNQDLLRRISYDSKLLQQFETLLSVMHCWDG